MPLIDDGLPRLDQIPAAALTALRGSRVERFRYELHRQVQTNDGLKWQVVDDDLQEVRECSLNFNRLAKIKGTATFKIVDNGDSHVNYLSDVVRVFWNFRAAAAGSAEFEYTMGTYLLNTPNLPLLKTGRLREVTCYDSLVVADQNKLNDWLTVEPSEYVTLRVIALLHDAFPLAGILIPLSPVQFGSPPKVFEAGMSTLDVANRMLAWCGYTSLRVDANGSFVSTPYITPRDRTVEFTYSDSTYPLFVADQSVFEQDIFDAPTKFVRSVGKPDDEAPFPLLSEYNVPSGPFSEASRGRPIVDYASVQVADQTTLDTLTKAEAEEMIARKTQCHFQTPLMPHSWANVYLLDYSRLPTGYQHEKWIEEAWTFPCVAGGVMQHTAGWAQTTEPE